MRMRLLALLLLLLPLEIAGLAAAEGAAEGPADGAEIRGVIERQLAAFGRDDGPGAFAFASPDIRQRFGTPEIFMDMVRRHYAAVHRPSDVDFGPLRETPRGLAQEVWLTGPDGRAVTAVYIMERQPDGSWKIDGVYLVESPDLGA